ncbi:hypothetical protein RSO68_00005 [Halomonas saccharevitans]|uniref:Uncharacterized protein n=1 Tax=Halomonas saccharevitans TaxID=416872 RepID=A0ABU3N9G2_9GAMM|nr:hypothetical protein [Halomonas saccharevitans]MDT8877849.1 hypothetical protein [Halomonas saccharevitans]
MKRGCVKSPSQAHFLARIIEKEELKMVQTLMKLKFWDLVWAIECKSQMSTRGYVAYILETILLVCAYKLVNLKKEKYNKRLQCDAQTRT